MESDRSLGELRAEYRRQEPLVESAAAARHGGGEIPRPPHWGGYRVRPEAIEFWQGHESRLHDRLLCTPADGGGWRVRRLAP